MGELVRLFKHKIRRLPSIILLWVEGNNPNSYCKNGQIWTIGFVTINILRFGDETFSFDKLHLILNI